MKNTTPTSFLAAKLISERERLAYATKFAVTTNLVSGERTETPAVARLRRSIAKIERQLAD